MGYSVWRVGLLLVLPAVLAGQAWAVNPAGLQVRERPVVVAGRTWPAGVGQVVRVALSKQRGAPS
jgi:hypothetical protein